MLTYTQKSSLVFNGTKRPQTIRKTTWWDRSVDIATPVVLPDEDEEDEDEDETGDDEDDDI